MPPTKDPRTAYDAIRRHIEDLQQHAPIVAVVFADLAASTEYKSQRELITSLLKVYRHNSELQEQVEKLGGSIVKSLGDGIMASFVVHEPDDINLALDAAIRTQKHFQAANRRVLESEQIVSRIGLAVGPVVNFEVHSPSGASVADPHGPTVDRAARLCALAGPAQILCDAEAFSYAENGSHKYTFSEPATRRLKGFSEPVTVYALDWQGAAAAVVPHLPPMYHSTGFLTTTFVMQCVAESSASARVVGLSNRHYCDNIELYNLLAAKIAANPEYRFELTFLHPRSAFKAYAEQITRRRSDDLAPEIRRNIASACRLFQPLQANVTLVCADYPMSIPFVQSDDRLHFSLPLRSAERTNIRVGVVGGPYFTAEVSSDLGRAILESVERDARVMIAPDEVLRAGDALDALLLAAAARIEVKVAEAGA